MAEASAGLVPSVGTDEITPYLDTLQQSLQSAVSSLVRDVAQPLLQRLRNVAPVGRHYSVTGTAVPGGTLRDSLEFDIADTGAILLGAEHGVFVIGGTAPHPIVARNVPNLHFWWERMGQTFVGRSVHHPGNRPNDFRQQAVQDAFDDGSIDRAIARFWQNLGGAGEE